MHDVNIPPIEKLVALIKWLLCDASYGIEVGFCTLCFQSNAGSAASNLGLHLREAKTSV